MASPDAQSGTIFADDEAVAGAQPGTRPSLWRWLLNRVWYVHPGLQVTVKLSPQGVVYTLAEATKPRMMRLDLSEVYERGRRYFITPRADGGFRLTTTNKVSWHYRRRTTATAVVRGDVTQIDEARTRLQLNGRIRIPYLVDIAWLPLFMMSLIIFMPWPPIIMGVLIVLLFGLSWFGHRYHASLEVHEMMFFVEKVLQDHIAEADPLLTAEAGADVVMTQRDFASAWDQFLGEHHNDV